MLTHGELMALAAGIGASGVCLVVVAGVGVAMSSWRDALDVTRIDPGVSELQRRAADKARDDAILAAWKERNPLPAPTSPWSPTEVDSVKIRAASKLLGNMQQARPTLREAVEGLPDGAPIQIATKRELRLITGEFCPDTTAERARAALEAAKMGVPDQTALKRAWDRLSLSPASLMCDPDEFVDPEPDVYAWRSVAEVLGR